MPYACRSFKETIAGERLHQKPIRHKLRSRSHYPNYNFTHMAVDEPDVIPWVLKQEEYVTAPQHDIAANPWTATWTLSSQLEAPPLFPVHSTQWTTTSASVSALSTRPGLASIACTPRIRLRLSSPTHNPRARRTRAWTNPSLIRIDTKRVTYSFPPSTTPLTHCLLVRVF